MRGQRNFVAIFKKRWNLQLTDCEWFFRTNPKQNNLNCNKNSILDTGRLVKWISFVVKNIFNKNQNLSQHISFLLQSTSHNYYLLCHCVLIIHWNINYIITVIHKLFILWYIFFINYILAICYYELADKMQNLEN
jgi:hypothetical protein